MLSQKWRTLLCSHLFSINDDHVNDLGDQTQMA
jgi:hypothetical protein